MIFGTDPRVLLLRILAILVAVTVHEYAHAWVADRQGDPTPRSRGRLSLNPLVHLDVVGSLLLLVAGFGWAKPVEVNPLHFANPRQGMMRVAAAGPLANVTVAFALGYFLRLGLVEAAAWPVQLALATIYINIVLAVFNLLPVPPLDGSRVLTGLLPPAQALAYERLAPYGPLLLLVLILMPGGLIGSVLGPPVSWLVALVLGGGVP
jgi:Zn-dependent protease